MTETGPARKAEPTAFDHGPPSIEDIERLGQACLAALPAAFARHVQGVVIRVEDFPDAATEQMMNLESPFDLLGLYHGIPVGHDHGFDTPRQAVDMIFLYRRTLLDYWCETGDSLQAIVHNTLIHENGHHFGLSDADMERIEFGPDHGA
jgi:predicted Zn-dependent protease with MMP-like domain